MNVKNYLVGSVHPIASSQWAWKDRSDEGDLYELYKEMYRQSRASFAHFLYGPYEEIIYQDPIDYVTQSSKLSWRRIYELWHSEKCNILACGPDVQVVKPLKIFNLFKEFRLFNWTDPKSYQDPNKTFSLPHYFNADMLYFPHTMDPETWNIYLEYDKTVWTDDTNVQNYGMDQIMANIMFWNQQPYWFWEDVHRPDLFYQAHWLPWVNINDMDAWNESKFSDAKVIHWHSSREAKTKLSCMRLINSMNNIKPYEGILNDQIV